jgi:hypothetical protein
MNRMLSYIVFGFVFPWIAGGYLYKKNHKVVLTIAPFASVIALSTNEFGLLFDFWDIQPKETESLNCLPLSNTYFIFHPLRTKKITCPLGPSVAV